LFKLIVELLPYYLIEIESDHFTWLYHVDLIVIETCNDQFPFMRWACMESW